MHGGGNHLIMPTGLMQHAAGNDTKDLSFGGGVIRVEGCSSTYINALYPGAMLSHPFWSHYRAHCRLTVAQGSARRT